MSLILSVDTASPWGSLAVSREHEIIGVVESHSTESHSVRLFAGIQFLLTQLHLSVGQFDAFAVTTGPGSFAGLRIGIATMKGLAEMQGRPMVGISTLEAIAAPLIEERLESPIIPLMDARRSEVFAGGYKAGDDGLQCLEADRVVGVETFFSDQPRSARVFAGPEIEKFRRWIEPGTEWGWTRRRTTPYLAAAVARCAFQKLARGDVSTPDLLPIEYLRRSDAETLFKG